MGQPFTDIDSIIRTAATEGLDLEAIAAFCRSKNLHFNELCNSIALSVARRFDDSLLTYEDADSVMNAVFGIMIAVAGREGDGFVFAEPAYSIYLAFDAGEYDHGDGKDPIEHHTKPLIKTALKDG
jgi:hypothetical protein